MTNPKLTAADAARELNASDPLYVIESRGSQGNGARYSTTGTPEGVVFFTSRAEARRVRDEITPDMPSKFLPMRVVAA
jgi:acyl-CoA synthetase (AMP-forming)/AMP-acid ligase II